MDAKSFAGPRSFARYMLQGDRLQLRPIYDQIMTFRGSFLESIVFRESCWQIELIAALPNAGTETHRHLRCSSADVMLNGVFPEVRVGRGANQPRRGPLSAQLRSIQKGEWHGADGGPKGFIALSFQQWDGEPTFISQDWSTP